MTVILKKDEKVENVIKHLSEKYSVEEFIIKFQELYPDDYKKIETNYSKHLRKVKPGKINPMPKPEQYLKNALNVWLKKS